jgi:methyltransferase (TIGR00027 family)
VTDADDLSIVDAVGATARLTAAARARETDRADRLFADPFAAQLAGAEGFAALDRHNAGRAVGSALVENPVFAIRTRFFDDFLLREASERDVRQIVLVAAGLDTRAFRLAWPTQVQIYELDQPEVLAYKHAILADARAEPAAHLHSIAVDLRKPWSEPLIEAGYRRHEAAAWLAEGLTFYLNEPVVQQLFDDIGALAASGDRFGTDFVAIPPPEIDAEIRFTTSDPVGLLRAWGWDAQQYSYDVEGAQLGRPWPYPGRPNGWMVTATPMT